MKGGFPTPRHRASPRGKHRFHCEPNRPWQRASLRRRPPSIRVTVGRFTVPQVAVKQHTTLSSHGIEFPHTHQLGQNIVKWINANLTTPEFQEFQRKRLKHTLYDNLNGELADLYRPRKSQRNMQSQPHLLACTCHKRHCHNASTIFGTSLFAVFRYQGTSIFKTCVNFIFRAFISCGAASRLHSTI